MIDAQTLTTMFGGIGVGVAAIYYILTLKNNQKTQELALKTQQQNLETRRIGLVDSIINRTYSEVFARDHLELLRFEWSDYEDFERKYGSESNVEAAAKRFRLWFTMNAVGGMLRKGLLEAEDCYDAGMQSFLFSGSSISPSLMRLEGGTG